MPRRTDRAGDRKVDHEDERDESRPEAACLAPAEHEVHDPDDQEHDDAGSRARGKDAQEHQNAGQPPAPLQSALGAINGKREEKGQCGSEGDRVLRGAIDAKSTSTRRLGGLCPVVVQHRENVAQVVEDIDVRHRLDQREDTEHASSCDEQPDEEVDVPARSAGC